MNTSIFSRTGKRKMYYVLVVRAGSKKNTPLNVYLVILLYFKANISLWRGLNENFIKLLIIILRTLASASNIFNFFFINILATFQSLYF